MVDAIRSQPNTAAFLKTLRMAAGILARVALAGVAAGAAQADAAQTIWFQQPSATLAQNFRVAHSTDTVRLPPGTFTVHQWQPNPFSATQDDAPATWNMAGYTGLSVPVPLSQSEAGVQNKIGSTGVQLYQGTVGINLNSRDFSATGTANNLVGIMPGYKFPDLSHRPFAQPNATLVYSVDMQVVTATVTRPLNNPKYNGDAYVALDLRFVDTTHPQSMAITVCASAFSVYGSQLANTGYAPAGGGNVLVKTSINPGSPFISMVPGTAAFRNTVWSGFKTFAISLTADNLGAAILAIQADAALLSSLGLTSASYSRNPSDYILSEVHVNSELNYAGRGTYTSGSVQMGLSIRNMKVVLQ